MTEAACRFITPVTMQALSGKPVATDLWDASVANAMGHIELSRDRELIVVAPASADFIAKLANGLADDLLSTLCLARECPLLVAPAMNRQMWDNSATQRNVRQLQEDGVRILGPASGDQACGEVGMGRMLEAEQLYEEIVAAPAAAGAGGCAGIDHRRPDLRADRCGARHHQPQLGPHGLRGGPGRTGGWRAGHAGVRPHRPGPARGRQGGAHGLGRGHARRSQRGGRQRTGLRQRRGGRRLPRGQAQRAEDQEERSGIDARAGAHRRHPRIRRGSTRCRRSASASPPRATTSTSLPKTSGAARSCRCWWAISPRRRSARKTARSCCTTTLDAIPCRARPKIEQARALIQHIARLYPRDGKP